MTGFYREFTNNGFTYVLTDAGYSCDGRLVRFTKWDGKGQLVDAGHITANSFTEAKERLLGI